MKVVAVTSGGALEVREASEPEASEGWVVVRVSYCGICGSDIHLLHSPLARDGLVMGHEFAGEVVSVGAGVSEIAEGDTVTVLPAARCVPGDPSECPACVAGESQRCALQATASIGITIPGAYAELVAAPASSCVPIPATMPDEAGALVEPLAVAVHGIGLSSFEPGMDVGVIGAGPIGALATLALKALGAGRVAVAEPGRERARRAESLGADAVVGSAGSLANALGTAPDLILECAGRVETPGQAIGAVRPGGEVILVGVTAFNEMVRISSVIWVVKEVTVRGAIAYTTDEFRNAVGMIAEGTVSAMRVVTGIRPLADAPGAFEELAGDGGQLKILLSPLAG